MPGIFKKKKPSGIRRLLRLMSARKDRNGLAFFNAGRKTAKASARKSARQAAAAGLSKKDARRAAAAAKIMTKAEMGILKAGIGIGISKAVHSGKAKQLLCGAVERFLQL